MNFCFGGGGGGGGHLLEKSDIVFVLEFKISGTWRKEGRVEMFLKNQR